MDRTQFWVRVGTAIIAMALAAALAASAVAGRFPLWLRSAQGPARDSGAPSPRPSGTGSGSPSPSQTPGPPLPALSLQQMAGQRVPVGNLHLRLDPLEAGQRRDHAVQARVNAQPVRRPRA